MAGKEDMLYIEAILRYIGEIETFVSDYPTVDTALEDYRNYMAILRLLQIMSETTQRLSEPLKSSLPEIDWIGIKGFRNILVHEYLGDIDTVIVRGVITKELPKLKTMLEKAKRHERH